MQDSNTSYALTIGIFRKKVTKYHDIGFARAMLTVMPISICFYKEWNNVEFASNVTIVNSLEFKINDSNVMQILLVYKYHYHLYPYSTILPDKKYSCVKCRTMPLNTSRLETNSYITCIGNKTAIAKWRMCFVEMFECLKEKSGSNE